MVRFQYAGALGNVEHPFIVIASRSTLARRGSTQQCPMYESKTLFDVYTVKTNDLSLIVLFEIELCLHLTVCKQMTDI